MGLPRERPKLRLMPMLSMESTDMLDTHMLMVPTLPMPTHTPMPHMLLTPLLLLLPQLSPRLKPPQLPPLLLLQLLPQLLMLLPQLLPLPRLLPQLSLEPPRSAHLLP